MALTAAEGERARRLEQSDRHILVDTNGFVLKVLVHRADFDR